MASYASFGTRNALSGRRYSKYSVDPALLLEAERIQNEYALMPGREARGLQALQFDRSLSFQESEAEKNRQASEKSGMMGTAAGVLTNAAMIRALTMEKGASFFGGGGPVMVDTAGAGMASGMGGTGAVIPAGSAVPGGGTALGSVSTGEAAATASGAGAGGSGALGAAGGWAAIGTLGKIYGGGLLESMGGGPGSSSEAAKAGRVIQDFGPVGRAVWTEHFGGKKDDVVGIATNFVDPIGYAVGRVVDLIKETWLCTAISKYVGTSKEQKSAMKKLRRYAKQNHRAWLNAYFVDGPLLIEGIEKGENDLQAFYTGLRNTLVVPVVDLVTKGQMEAAFVLYRKITIDLCKKYAPQIDTEVKKESNG